MLVTQPDHKVIFLYPGQVLIVIADANSAGTVWRLGDQAGDPSQGSTTIAASGSSTFGPYAAQSRFDVVPSAGALTATIGLSAPGATVQAYDVDLQEVADLAPSNDDVIQRKAGVWTNRTIAQLLTDLGLAALYQPLDSDLTAIAALSTTAFGRALLALADAAALRTVAGLGTLATQSGTFSGTSSGTNTGDQDLSGKLATSGNNAALPTSDPAVAGRLWSNLGVVQVSNG